ncbi:hypothetical protein ANCCAN_17791 [Ancylostoma caninum]|uniref:Uncharacterized protein n=1 Tax=Ancylostoma caninum TaxID=29170 RepID=A0A368G156_ANCCA|nr:hypothetical protein ANCCAN_17791 [Ancylostoma caninum]
MKPRRTNITGRGTRTSAGPAPQTYPTTSGISSTPPSVSGELYAKR